MITIYDKHNTAYIIRPCPFINITWNSNSNEDMQLGGKYDITFTGTLLSHAGSPIFQFDQRTSPSNGISWTPSYYPSGPGSKPSAYDFTESGGLNSILAKQIALRELFSRICEKIEVASVNPGDSDPIITFYPKFLSLNFADAVWVNKCEYTVNLEAQFLLDKDDKVIGSESYATKTFKPGSNGWPDIANGLNSQPHRLTIDELLKDVGGFVEDFQESWSLEPEDGNGNTVDPYTSENIIRVYRLTRNISAKGKNISGYECFGNDPDKNKYRAHEQARRYVINHIQNSGTASNHYDDYPGLSTQNPLSSYFGSGLLNLNSAVYTGYNHSRTENIDVTQGSYGVQDTWILSSGNAHENYNLSLSLNEGDPRNKVSIQGTIKGLTSIPGSGSIFGGNHETSFNTPYENAINKYRTITNSGQFGINAHVYKRAQNAAGGIRLNEIPLSVSLGTNEFTGEINYTIEYDDRPKNILGSGVKFENLSVSDTYPGDVFAIIPVIGRKTGPVLQYIGSRTEYQRSLSLEVVVDRSSQSGMDSRQNLLQKPSLYGSTRSGIIDAVNAYSPAREPGIRKYFVSPPQETWDPKEGRYTLNITWTYELNH